MNLTPTMVGSKKNAQVHARAHARFVATMVGVRRLCRERSIERAEELAERFQDALIRFRASPAAGGFGRSPSDVSIALDRFIGEARSAAELSAGPTEPNESDFARVEQSVGTLNQMYVASEQAISVGTMSPASFMPGAEVVVKNALREVRAATEQFKPVDQAVDPGRPKVGAHVIER